MGENNDNTIVLKVEVPIACFRDSRAREYIATYPVPPPSTVYGMLLSTVGEENRFKHCGVKLAIAMLSETAKSRVIRKIRRFKERDIHSSKNSKPDYQELLTGIKFVVWIDLLTDDRQHGELKWIAQDEYGELTLPYWVDRLGSAHTRWQRYTLIKSVDWQPSTKSWTQI